jgi:hypothetical protein
MVPASSVDILLKEPVMAIARVVALSVMALLVAAPARAQAGSASTAAQQTYELRLVDGSVLFGTVVQEGPTEVVFRSISGVEIRVPRENIVMLRRARGEVVEGSFYPSDPNATRLLFAPTGRSLRRGEGYLGVYYFVMPFVQVGLTDRISVGGGTPLIFGFDEGQRPFWLTPKVQVLNRPRLKAAAGVMHIVVPSEATIGIAYGVVTSGSADAAVTVGVGAGYARSDGESNATAILMVGGERRVHRGVKLLTENYIWQGGDGIVSGAVRFYGERLSADLGLFVPLGIGDFFAAPFVNFVWAF